MTSPPTKYQLLPPLRPEELRALEADIRRRGVLLPIDIDSHGHILDGHHRAAIARRLGIPCPTLKRSFSTEREKREHAVKMNLARRHLDPIRWGQAFALLLKVRGVKTGQGARNDMATSATVAEVAAEVGVPVRTAAYRLHLAHSYESLPKRVQAKVASGALTVGQGCRCVKRSECLRALKADAATVRRNAARMERWRIDAMDCLAGLAEIRPGSIRLAFADPPYNQGIDYGTGATADRRTDAEYLSWCRCWMRAVVRTLAPDGSLWVLISDEHADDFGRLLRESGLHRRQWLIWYETFGVNCTHSFNRCSRHLFWMVKDPKHFVFHDDAVRRPADRQTKYHDRRARPGGKLWDSVWGVNPPIPRLVENSHERLPGFPTQLPLALLAPIIACASDPGDVVLDPFCGSGTTGEAALRLGRRFVGLERNAQYAARARARLHRFGAKS